LQEKNAMEVTGANLNLRSHHFVLLDLEIFVFLSGTPFSLNILIVTLWFSQQNTPQHDSRADAPGQ
jgi:hypothetical protein